MAFCEDHVGEDGLALMENRPHKRHVTMHLVGRLMLNQHERIIQRPILFKFGQRANLESFREDGLLYMRQQSAFSKMEDDCIRGDKFEGITYIACFQ